MIPTSESHPSVIILAGPNGAGKSTVAPALLQQSLGVTQFVDADVIARGLSPFNVDSAAIAAGRIMLARLRELARRRVSFAFETTLASRSFKPWLENLKRTGYAVHILFLWLPSAEFAIARVADRVRMGGHNVPAETVRRRYGTGLRNFFDLYEPLASTWSAYDASAETPRLIAERVEIQPVRIYDESRWVLIRAPWATHEH